MTLNSLMRTVSAGALLAASLFVSTPGAHAQAAGGNGGWFVPKAAHPDAPPPRPFSVAFPKPLLKRKKKPLLPISSRLLPFCLYLQSRLLRALPRVLRLRLPLSA